MAARKARKKVARKTTSRKTADTKTSVGRRRSGQAPVRGKKRLSSTPARSSSAREDRGRTGPVRLNKYLADHGVASRRQCDELIAAGKVNVDGEPVTTLGTKIDPTTQAVEVAGVLLKPEKLDGRYYLLNKPTGVVCTNERRETRPRATGFSPATLRRSLRSHVVAGCHRARRLRLRALGYFASLSWTRRLRLLTGPLRVPASTRSGSLHRFSPSHAWGSCTSRSSRVTLKSPHTTTC